MGSIRRRYEGQVGLLILLVVGIVVTVVMSVASSSLGDLVASRQEKGSGEVFRVAEQGVEEALNKIRLNPSNPSGGSLSWGNLVTGRYQVEQRSQVEISMKEGEVIEIDLNGFTGSSLNIDWILKNSGEDVVCSGEGSGVAPAGLEVAKYKTDGTVERLYYNANGCNLSNSFDSAGVASDNRFVSGVSLTGLGNVKFLRVRLLYNRATLLVTGSGLSNQLYVISSHAEISSQAGNTEVAKDIEVRRTKEFAAGIFDFAVFTGGTIVK